MIIYFTCDKRSTFNTRGTTTVDLKEEGAIEVDHTMKPARGEYKIDESLWDFNLDELQLEKSPFSKGGKYNTLHTLYFYQRSSYFLTSSRIQPMYSNIFHSHNFSIHNNTLTITTYLYECT